MSNLLRTKRMVISVTKAEWFTSRFGAVILHVMNVKNELTNAVGLGSSDRTGSRSARAVFLKAMSGTRRSGSLPRQEGRAARVLPEHSSSYIDGMRVIQERNVSNTPTVAYTRGNDLSGSLEGAGGIGGLLGRSHGYSSGTWSTHNHYHADGNGNVTFLVNSGQTAEAEYGYDPYGRTMAQSGNLATANVYRFSSKEIHGQSGMYYYGFRFYDPHLQRWPNRDPIGEAGGINLYLMAYNDPLSWVDPFGLAVYLETHPVPPSGQRHAKLILIPDSPERWMEHPDFRCTEDGLLCLTIGAGNEHGQLVSRPTRERDVDRGHNTSSTRIDPPEGMSDDQFIGALLNNDANYSDRLPYNSQWPLPSTAGYNSNGYISGLLNSVGLQPQQPPRTPGWGYRVPSEAFQPRRTVK